MVVVVAGFSPPSPVGMCNLICVNPHAAVKPLPYILDAFAMWQKPPAELRTKMVEVRARLKQILPWLDFTMCLRVWILTDHERIQVKHGRQLA